MGDSWLDDYTGQTTEELLALAATHRIDSIVLAFEQALEAKAASGGTDALTSEERVVLAVEAIEREVNNGGYHQFFSNSSCEYAMLAESALVRINCPKTAKVTADAIALLGIDGPPTEAAVTRALEADVTEVLSDALDACDSAYYRTGENIGAELFEFIRANRATIRLP